MTLSEVGLSLVESVQDVEDFLRWLGQRRPILAVDIETTGLHLGRDRIRLVQFGDAQHGWAIPYEEWRGVIRHALGTYEGPIVLHHGKFDAGFLLRDGLPFPWERMHDTMLMCFLHDSEGPRALKDAAATYVDPLARSGEKQLKRIMTKNRWNYDTVPIDLPEYWGYSAMDVVLTARLAEYLWPHVQYAREAYDLELACQRVLCEMEQRGVMIDTTYCEEKFDQLREELSETEAQLGDVSPFSPRDIIAALEREGATLTKRTQNNNASVDDEVLSDLAAKGNRTAKLVLKARYLNKVGTSYFGNFLDYHVNDIVHPHIHQLAARTGRMSVTEPALQTIPRTALVRNAFVARPGNSLLLIDYAAQELRVAAHIGQDELMLEAFREGRDLHGETARALYGEGYQKRERQTAKNAMFSYTYGAGPPKFAKTAGVTIGEAEAAFTTLRRLYPGLTRAMGQVTQVVKDRAGDGEYGYVQLLFDGRRLKVRADKAYAGLNTLIQGSCAVVLKRALVDLDAAGLGEFLNLPIHDEVMFDVPVEQLDDVVPAATEVMRREDFRAPLEVEHKTVQRWGEAYE